MNTSKNETIKFINLKFLIISLAVLITSFSILNTFSSAYSVQRQQLLDANAHANFVYASKLATSTDDFIKLAQKQLFTSAHIVANNFNNTARLREEVDRLRMQAEYFNSIVIINKDAQSVITSPETLYAAGRTINSPGVLESLKAQHPTISNQYISNAGNLIILFTQPIFNNKGNYLGIIGGSIYLKQENMLHNLLGDHYRSDESFVYITDKSKKIIYHPNSLLVGTYLENNDAIDKALQGQSGSQIIIDEQATPMITGYAHVPSTGWGVIYQRPVSVTLKPLRTLMSQVLIKTLPITTLIIIFIWWCASNISKPLKLLATEAKLIGLPKTKSKIHKIKPWYFEAKELKKAMIISSTIVNSNISKLKEDILTDSLTKLGNRRALELNTEHLMTGNKSFSVIAIDIDNFKKINDTHGHDIGDKTLQDLASLMTKHATPHSLVFRTGGEEFLMIIKNTNETNSKRIAEQLRKKVELTRFEKIGNITISIGVASWPIDNQNIKTVFKLADNLLYRAKQNGKNRVESLSIN